MDAAALGAFHPFTLAFSVISLHGIGIFRWLISSWFNFGWLHASRNLFISSRFSSLLEYEFSKYSLIIF
jgi:hypothetical protein